MPKVSICIPTYNQVSFLKFGLESILSQSYKDYEIIVTDDSDNNDVKELIAKYDFNGKLSYYRNEPAMGSPKNWNYCLSKAVGDYIKILHHDDWFSTDTSLEKLVKLLESDDNSIAFCGCNNISIDGDNLFHHSITKKEASILKTCPEFLFFENKIGAPSVTIFKRSDLIFDENIKYLVDLEFYIQLLNKKNKFSYTTDALVNIGHSPHQVTNIFLKNKNLLVFEYSYTFKKLNITKQSFIWCFKAFWNLFDLLNIYTVNELKNSGWHNEVPIFVSNIISAKNSIKKMHLSMFRRIFQKLVYMYSSKIYIK